MYNILSINTKPFYRTLILGFALLISDLGTAQNLPLRPHIVNFTPKQYGSNPFILCAAKDRYSRIYFGTGSNILIYDGNRWDKVPTGSGNWTETLLAGEKEIREILSIVVRPFPAQRNVASQRLNSQPADELWLGTFFDGVFRVLVDRAGKVLRKEHYTNEQGVPEGNTKCYGQP